MLTLTDPSIDPMKLSLKEKIELVRRSNGLLIDLLKGERMRDLNLDNCTGLTELPKGLKVGGYLYLYKCIGLKELPEGLKVKGSLYLARCIGLTELPGGLEVGGNLYLNGCIGLKELPEGLKVGGSLYLHGCTGLTRLPKGLNPCTHILGWDFIYHKCLPW